MITLWGRDRETAALDRVLEETAGGRGSALVLWGDPGIGKSALLEHAAGRAGAFTVLRCRGTRTESALAFAALHELLWPLTDRIDALPAPQARALRGALGLAEDGADRFLIGAATLTLLAGLAAERPVLVVADDGQWLDDASAQCLAFVARRLHTARIALLVTAHDDPAGGHWDGLPALAVPGLSDDAARHLLEGVEPGRAERVLRAAHGNPLALLELPHTTASGGSVGPRLRQAFHARVATLSAPARTLLLTVAAEDHGDAATLQHAAAALGAGPAAWREALASGLLRTAGDRVEFRHPLVRPAVYEDAPFAERQAVHRALAAALDGDDHLDRRAWHLAAAVTRPDETVARLLDTAAERARARGADMAAARAWERAAALSPVRDDGTVRLARAAYAAWESGDRPTARRLLGQAEARGPQTLVVDAGRGLRGQMEFFSGDQERAHRLLLEQAGHASPGLAAELRGLADCAAWAAGTSDDLVLDAADLDLDTPLTSLAAARQWTAPVALAWGAERAARDAYQQSVTGLRTVGGDFRLIIVLPQLATVRIPLGEWDQAARDAVETLRLAEQTGTDNIAAQARNRLAWLAAMRGDTATVEELTDLVLANARPGNARSQIAAAYWNQGLAALGEERPDAAFHRLTRLVQPGHEAAHPTFARLAVGDAVEAGVRTGQDVTGHLDLITAWARHTGAAWAAAMAHRCRALVAEDAEPHFRRALETGTGRPFEDARTRLLYGEWLRRERRRAEARPLLTAACDTFEALSARPWAARARAAAELAGAAPAERRPGELTPQELRVARLAATGLTNREIAAQLYISPRTVGHHLSNVFAKLGLATRAELARIDFDDGLRLTT